MTSVSTDIRLSLVNSRTLLVPEKIPDTSECETQLGIRPDSDASADDFGGRKRGPCGVGNMYFAERSKADLQPRMRRILSKAYSAAPLIATILRVEHSALVFDSPFRKKVEATAKNANTASTHAVGDVGA